MIERIAITGSSGYYGRKFIEYLRRVAPEVRILGVDIVAPTDGVPDEFQLIDVRSPKVRTVLGDFRPDTILHLAFVVNPIRDLQKMHEINVVGTQNIMEAVRAIRPRRFQLSSSATAYGAWPDNPVPIEESWPLRACGTLQYALDKVRIEEDVQKLAAELPEVAVSWTRPAVICGAGIKNYIIDVMLHYPIVILPNGRDVPLQFVHEQDLVAATWEILSRDARGAFNVAPPDWVGMVEVGRLTNRWAVSSPFWIMKSLAVIRWAMRFPHPNFPPGFADFFRYPWVVTPARLERELGFRFQHSSREILIRMWMEYRHSVGKSVREPAAPSRV
jgi:UDP-glucose 4-epimerase